MCNLKQNRRIVAGHLYTISIQTIIFEIYPLLCALHFTIIRHLIISYCRNQQAAKLDCGIYTYLVVCHRGWGGGGV